MEEEVVYKSADDFWLGEIPEISFSKMKTLLQSPQYLLAGGCAAEVFVAHVGSRHHLPHLRPPRKDFNKILKS